MITETEIKKGTVYVDEDGNVLTVRNIDEMDQITVDLEGEFKSFDDSESFNSFLEERGFELTEVQMDDEKITHPDDDDDEDDDEEDGDETDEEEDNGEGGEESEKEERVQRFQALYNQMLELGMTGNSKIDGAIQKLKKELSSELNIMTSENTNFDSLHNTLKAEGYIK